MNDTKTLIGDEIHQALEKRVEKIEEELQRLKYTGPTITGGKIPDKPCLFDGVDKSKSTSIACPCPKCTPMYN